MKLRASGRGRHYSVGRALLESFLEAAYVGDWPARLWGIVPGATEVSLTRHSLPLPPGGGERCRVAFVSDIHVGPTTPPALLESAFDAIRKAEPDVLLLGGDYVFLEAERRRLALLRALVESVRAPSKLAVLGNHDLWTRDAEIVRALSSAGARVLINDAIALPAPWADVVVIGLDDPWTGRCDPLAAAGQLDGQPFRIVLCHSPDGLVACGTALRRLPRRPHARRPDRGSLGADRPAPRQDVQPLPRRLRTLRRRPRLRLARSRCRRAPAPDLRCSGSPGTGSGPAWRGRIVRTLRSRSTLSEAWLT